MTRQIRDKCSSFLVKEEGISKWDFENRLLNETEQNSTGILGGLFE
jgi:hypothetical protein